jgi:hypothetical protein
VLIISVLCKKLGGEERTAGSDQKVRYSSGGPISLDPVRTILITIFAIILRISSALMGDGGGLWGVGGVGGGVGGRAIHDIIQ